MGKVSMPLMPNIVSEGGRRGKERRDERYKHLGVAQSSNSPIFFMLWKPSYVLIGLPVAQG